MAIFKIKDKAINLNHVRYCEVGSTYETGSQTWFVFVSFDIGGCKIPCEDETEAMTILKAIVNLSK